MSELFAEATPQEQVSQESTQTQEPAAQASAENNSAQTTPSVEDLFATKLAEIKAPDGRQKYASIDQALESIPNADAKIMEQAELIRTLQTQLSAIDGIEEMVKQLQSKPQENQSTPATAVVDQEAVSQLVREQFAAQERQIQAQANLKMVEGAMSTKFGDLPSSQKAIAGKAEELGVNVTFFKDLAVKAPKAFLAYFDLKPTLATSSSASGDVNSESLMIQQQQRARPERKAVGMGATTKDIVAQYQAHLPQP